MPCNNCTPTPPTSFPAQYFYSTPQDCALPCGDKLQGTACILYTGPDLSCSGVQTNDTIETVLQKIDQHICTVTGNYAAYNYSCLDDSTAITTEAGFVAAISQYVCTLRNDFNYFTGTTYEGYKTDIVARFRAIEVPAITCTSAGVVNTDTYWQVLGKYCTKFGALDSFLSLSGVDWAQCHTVSSPPTTLAGAFSLVLDQICQVNASNGALPVFNNTGSCLASPGTADTLVSTIGKIKTKLCSLPGLTATTLTSSCIAIPSTDTDLQTLLQSMLTKMDSLSVSAPVFNPAHFSVAATDGAHPCAGITVSLLSAPSSSDRLVAATVGDSSPGVLAVKLQAGTNVSLDSSSVTGKIVINSTAVDDRKVKANTADSAPDFLDQKVNGGTSNGLSIGTAYNSGTGKVDIVPSINFSTFLTAFIDAIKGDDTLRTEFCGLVASCPYGYGTDECTFYKAESDTIGDVTVQYQDCMGGNVITLILHGSGSYIEFCAREGSATISSGGALHVLGTCAGGTTTSTTTTTTTTAGL